MNHFYNYSLLEHNTFGIDAMCRQFLEYETGEEAQIIAQTLETEDYPLLIIGGGSNLLLTQDFPGTVIHSAIKGIYVIDDDEEYVYLLCGSGETWDDVVEYCVESGWYGAENLSLIPGDVGASAVQNIGAYGAEVCQIINSIEAVELSTGEFRNFSAEECGYGYRQSRFKGEWKDKYLITCVTYKLRKKGELCLDYGNIRAELERKNIANPSLRELREAIIDIRNAKLPDWHKEGNAGSFFMNPVVERAKYEELAAIYQQMPHYTVDENYEKIPAGWMIDQCGWKGKSLGKAGVHDKQALVLVNRGGATGADIVRLMETIQRDVKAKFDIEIFPEVNIR